ncbi:MAC/perforin domain containing protein [Babesia divergens]|uniref:MAC/perforin domain containing protein n=1 Tax=Babesia divergens TaxID=32595 RepID=A0AAD9GF31_BABDI|nr:MAC/perforin domain containing protein [Babesia divergens]
MDDALRSLLNGGGGDSRNTYAPRTKKQPKQVEDDAELGSLATRDETQTEDYDDEAMPKEKPTPASNRRRQPSSSQKKGGNDMDSALKALLGKGGDITSALGITPKSAKQDIKPHNETKTAPKTDDDDLDFDLEDSDISGSTSGGDDESADFLPETVTESAIKRAGATDGEKSAGTSKTGQQKSTGIDDNELLDELTSGALDGKTEDKPIKPANGGSEIDIEDDFMDGGEDLTPPEEAPKKGFNVDYGYNYKNEEVPRKLKRTFNKTEYRNLDPQLNTDPFNDEGMNAGLSAALRYLGSGYDIVFGNPLGDPTIMVDPGYRDPVLKLDWTEEYHNHDGANIKEPRGAWIRPELSCRQAESVDHVNTIEDYKRELSVDAQLSADIPFYFSFSASSGYRNFVKTLSANLTKSYILKTYCLRYVAGIHDRKNVATMPSFDADVVALPDAFDAEKCPMDKYRNNEEDQECSDSVRPWMKFFQKYGTHYTTIIHLGGKITNQIQIKKTDVASLQKHGYNIDATIKANAGIPFLSLGEANFSSSGEISSDSRKNTLNHDKLIIVIGGDVPTDGTDKVSMKEWTKSLYKKPMPIKVNLESIKTLITDEKKKNIFDTALKYYAEVYGISQDEMYQTEGRDNGIASLAMKGHPVVFHGNAGGSAVCPQNKVIMMGFAMSVTQKRKTLFHDIEYVTSIAPCPIGKEKCVATVPEGKNEVRIWILCGEEPIPLLIQESKVTDNAPAVASCPNDYSIAFGFGISIPKGLEVTPADGYACRAGQSTCTHSSNHASRNAVWIACVEKNAPELGDITNHAVAVSTPGCTKRIQATDFKDNICPQNSQLITSWKMQMEEGNKNASPKMTTCPAASNGCQMEKFFQGERSVCKAQFSWVSCYSPPELSDRKQ